MFIKWLKPNGLEIETNDFKDTVNRAYDLGWKRKDSILNGNDGDKGSGEFNSIEWHVSAIKGMDNKDEIADYIKRLNGVKLSKRGGLETVKSRAIDLINEVE